MIKSLSAIGVMLWDASGNLWVGHREGDFVRDIREYEVLDGQGRWLSTLEMPEGVGQIFDIGDDYLLTTGLDQYGVQYLQMYGIEKSGG